MITKKSLPIVVENITIGEMVAEGKCIAKIEDLVVFVEQAAPGDIADVKIFSKKKNFAEGRAINIKQNSPNRQEPFCEHFGTCGGCKWQHLDYNSQLIFKQKQVYDALIRIGKVEIPELETILPSSKTTYYRNKLEYTFSNKRWLMSGEDESTEFNALGFHIPLRYDKILDINHCYLQQNPSNHIRLAVKRYAIENNLSFFDLKKQEGLLRNLIIRTSTTGQLMVIVQFFKFEESIFGLMEYLKNSFKEITSLLYIINEKGNETYQDQNVITFAGQSFIEEEMEGLKFRIGPKSFYQTNSEQAYQLYCIVREFADLKANELVYDLYTGTGTIANFIAKFCQKVIGVEYVPQAIEDAEINSSNNNILNTKFYAGDMKKVLTHDFIIQNGRPDVIITDPPRAGMDKEVVEKIIEIEPDRIVYVSCNPATQARDLQLLDSLYKITKVRPVDMFPHTQHVENVVLLEKRK